MMLGIKKWTVGFEQTRFNFMRAALMVGKSTPGLTGQLLNFARKWLACTLCWQPVLLVA
jgi:hypothetical protein